MEELVKVAHQILVDKAMANKDRWGVHETHCCPDHGCKYSTDWCPVELGLTKERNNHCEDCEYEEEHPDPLSLLEAWVVSHSYCNSSSGGDVVFADEIIKVIEQLHANRIAVRDEGIRNGWWK